MNHTNISVINSNASTLFTVWTNYGTEIIFSLTGVAGRHHNTEKLFVFAFTVITIMRVFFYEYL